MLLWYALKNLALKGTVDYTWALLEQAYGYTGRRTEEAVQEFLSTEGLSASTTEIIIDSLSGVGLKLKEIKDWLIEDLFLNFGGGGPNALPLTAIAVLLIALIVILYILKLLLR